MALVRCDVNHALQDSDRLVEDRLCIGVEVSDGQGAPIEVRLEKEVGFDVRAF